MATTVITFGTYDLFHIGHLNLINRAAALGSRLVVGVSTDDLNFSKKGKRPFVSEQNRIEIIRNLKAVDAAFYEESLELKGEYIKEHSADVLVMGDDWSGRFDHFKSLCEVIYLPRTDGISSTWIKAELALGRT
ncbi:adenylyltransferase/cytidyltransferase family protein [Shinella zoogloeoides]|uniref:adenylyltransferase/cytidyltransferase family protein n=1 Tax=Shinella zoogloeoides TaxID=352475 RepID=UPI00273FCD01|nr:adenylyltransferase/cytidyltransferase family protein [Shinella zoogloeoides]WLR92189.1 adenylyltransferase/cytidyltransferase family protein [Shinella zoogloeoides]